MAASETEEPMEKDAICNCIFRLFSVHKKGAAVCVGYTTGVTKIIPSYDVIHLCILKGDENADALPEGKCHPKTMIVATPEEAEKIGEHLIKASMLWKESKKE